MTTMMMLFVSHSFRAIVRSVSSHLELRRSQNLRPSRRFRHCGNSSRVHVTRRRPGGTAGRAAERFGRSVTRLRTPGASRRSRRPRWMPVTATRAVLRDLAGLRTRLGLLASAPSRQNSGRLACRAASSRAFVAERGGRHAHALARPSVSARAARGTPVALPRRHTGASAPPPDRLRPANWCLPLATKPESRTRRRREPDRAGRVFVSSFFFPAIESDSIRSSHLAVPPPFRNAKRNRAQKSPRARVPPRAARPPPRPSPPRRAPARRARARSLRANSNPAAPAS